jgi:hypothetical protein
MRYRPFSIIIGLVLLGVPQAAPAADPRQASVARAAGAGLTVAVLDFEASDPGNAKLGEDIAAALTALLADQPGAVLVERQALRRAMEEHELSMTGAFDAGRAVKVGKLVGARVLVTGRAFRLGKELFITAKLIGTETSLIEGVLIKGAADADLGELVPKLAEKVADKLRTAGPRLTALPDLPDPLPGLKRKLAGRRLPAIALVVREEHRSLLPQAKAGPAPTSAAETEIRRLFLECGFAIREVSAADRARLAADKASWPAGLHGVDLLIVVDAFSEHAGRVGSLVCCSSRAEAHALQRDGDALLAAERVVSRGADLSEEIAAKRALQNAGRELSLAVLARLAEKLPAK